MAVYQAIIIDDDERVHHTLKAILAKLPLEFDCARSANEALEKMRAKTFDLALLDIIMPEIDGIEFLKIAAQEGLFLPPIVVVSAATDKALVMQALSLGASSYLFKPIDIETLRQAVADYLGLNATKRDGERIVAQPQRPSSLAPPKPEPPAIRLSNALFSQESQVEFDSLSRAMGNMTIHRRTATILARAKTGEVGELVYKDGKLTSVAFGGLTGIDALEAMKSAKLVKIVVQS